MELINLLLTNQQLWRLEYNTGETIYGNLIHSVVFHSGDSSLPVIQINERLLPDDSFVNGKDADEGHQQGIREGEESVEHLASHQGGHMQTQAGGQHHEDCRVDDGAGHQEDRDEEDERRGHPDHVLRHLHGELAALAEYDGQEVRLTGMVVVVVAVTVTALTLGRRGGGGGLELLLAEPQQSQEQHHGGLSLLSLLSLLSISSKQSGEVWVKSALPLELLIVVVLLAWAGVVPGGAHCCISHLDP